MKKDVIIRINTETSEVMSNSATLGIKSENLQGNLIIIPEPFIDGTGRFFIDEHGSIEMTKQENYYVIPILSSLLANGDFDYCFKITEPQSKQGIPVFVSEISSLKVPDTIESNEEIPEQYPTWIENYDSKIAEINNLEQSIEDAERNRSTNENERVTNEQNRESYINELKRARENGDLNGGTFTPSVDAEGNLSWTNNKELPNPKTQNIRGPQGPVGPQGEAFQIKKTYPSIEAMQADFNNMQIGDYVMIANSVELEDNAKLFTKTENAWVYITDFSGATGIQGPRGEQGIQGIQGEQGVGISNLEVRDGDLYVTLTNNTTQNAGTILTQEVKQWIVEQITENAESDFNTFYNEKVDSFEDTVDDKIAEIEALHTLHIISEEVIDI